MKREGEHLYVSDTCQNELQKSHFSEEGFSMILLGYENWEVSDKLQTLNQIPFCGLFLAFPKASNVAFVSISPEKNSKSKEWSL